jgi:hypothetical protein
MIETTGSKPWENHTMTINRDDSFFDDLRAPNTRSLR